jgi:hypothetical protein
MILAKADLTLGGATESSQVARTDLSVGNQQTEKRERRRGSHAF